MSGTVTSRRAFLRRAAAAAAVAAPAIWIPRRAAAQLNSPSFVAGLARAAVGGGACTLWKSQTTNNDYWGGSINTFQSQKIKNDSAAQVDVCKVRFWFKNGGTPANVYVKARTAQYLSGSDIGSASDTVVVDASHNDWVEFTWSSGAPSVAALTDFWIGWFADQSHVVRVGYDTSAPVGQYYEGSSYCLYRGSSAQTDSDMIFELWTLQ